MFLASLNDVTSIRSYGSDNRVQATYLNPYRPRRYAQYVCGSKRHVELVSPINQAAMWASKNLVSQRSIVAPLT